MNKVVDKRVKAFLDAVEKMRDEGKTPLAISTVLGTSETSIKAIFILLPKNILFK
jgi:hypothetical protein